MKNLYFILIIGLLAFGCKQTKTLSDNSVINKEELTEKNRFDLQYVFIDANKQMMLGNYTVAKDLFKKCVEIDKYDPAVYYKLATIALYEKNVDKALDYSAKAVQLNSENGWYQILLATIYEQKNMLEEAGKVYELLRKKDKNNPQYHIELAFLYSKSKKYKEAINVYEDIEDLFGISEGITLEKEKLYLVLGDKEAALNELKKLVAYFPNDTRYLGIVADYYMKDEKLEEAKNIYDQIIELEPDNGIVHISLATYYFIKADNAKSYQHLKTAIESKKVDSSIKTSIIVSITENKNRIKISSDKIDELVKILVEVNNDDYNAHLLYSDILLKQQNYVEAEKELKYVLNEIKDQYVLWEQLLLVQNQIGNFDGIFETSTEALEYFPNQAVFYLFKGIAGLQVDKIDEAIESLEFGKKIITKDDPQKVQFETYLAECYYKQENYKKAFELFDKIIENDPDNLMILNNYSYYLSEKGEDLEKAKEMSKKTVNADKNNNTYLDTYAWILFKLEDYVNAKIYIEKAVEYGGSKSAVIMEHYGDIIFKNGDIFNAVEAWKNAFEIKETEELKRKIENREL